MECHKRNHLDNVTFPLHLWVYCSSTDFNSGGIPSTFLFNRLYLWWDSFYSCRQNCFLYSLFFGDKSARQTLEFSGKNLRKLDNPSKFDWNGSDIRPFITGDTLSPQNAQRDTLYINTGGLYFLGDILCADIKFFHIVSSHRSADPSRS